MEGTKLRAFKAPFYECVINRRDDIFIEAERINAGIMYGKEYRITLTRDAFDTKLIIQDENLLVGKDDQPMIVGIIRLEALIDMYEEMSK